MCTDFEIPGYWKQKSVESVEMLLSCWGYKTVQQALASRCLKNKFYGRFGLRSYGLGLEGPLALRVEALRFSLLLHHWC